VYACEQNNLTRMILTCDVVSGYKLFIMTTETEKVDWAQTPCTAFQGARRVASGGLRQVALAVKEVLDNDQGAAVLIFDDITSRLIESQENGVSAVPSTLTRGVPQGPGRPKLGVVAREVTLLPRHWDWLNLQPGGASVALRKLVEEARKANSGRDRVRQSQEICYRFMSAMAGDRPGFEEATRALFAGNRERFEAQVQFWPEDIRDHAKKLAEVALGGADGQDAG
jgi:hypothetical protein